MKTVIAVLEYEGQHYTVTDDNWDETWYDNDEAAFRRGVQWQWVDGNYSCDCNRFLFIERTCGVDLMPDEDYYPCGDRITLASLRIEGDPVCIMCNGTGKDYVLAKLPSGSAYARPVPCEHCNGLGNVT